MTNHKQQSRSHTTRRRSARTSTRWEPTRYTAHPVVPWSRAV